MLKEMKSLCLDVDTVDLAELQRESSDEEEVAQEEDPETLLSN